MHIMCLCRSGSNEGLHEAAAALFIKTLLMLHDVVVVICSTAKNNQQQIISRPLPWRSRRPTVSSSWRMTPVSE